MDTSGVKRLVSTQGTDGFVTAEKTTPLKWFFHLQMLLQKMKSWFKWLISP